MSRNRRRPRQRSGSGGSGPSRRYPRVGSGSEGFLSPRWSGRSRREVSPRFRYTERLTGPRGAKPPGSGRRRRRTSSRPAEPLLWGPGRPWLVAAAAEDGSYWEEPGWESAVRVGNRFRRPREEELVELPRGALVQFLPGRVPLGWMRGADADGAPDPVDGALALAARLPSGWTRTLLPAYRREEGAPELPLFDYSAVVFREDRLFCAALQVEDNPRWRPQEYGRGDLPRRVQELRRRFPENRLVAQLEVCARQYGCYNAQNIFYGRWEGAIPVSPACNSECRGCISFQPADRPPSPQERLDFVPTVEEIVELGSAFLSAGGSILSFGQGCEGEPTLRGDVIGRALKTLRSRFPRATLHLNTNGSRPRTVEELARSGLTSMRLSLNSAVPERYTAYYRPRGYTFADLEESIRRARGHGVFVSLNLLCVPGVNDAEEEMEALLDFLERNDVQMVQLRNLNIDPDRYLSEVPLPRSRCRGVPAMVQTLRREAPRVRLGCHNPALGS